MAGFSQSSVQDQLADVTECSICTETLTNPKILPCIHTFCLHCLENYGKGKNPGDGMVCPICRKEFVIPDEGLGHLPVNFFIQKIVDIGKLAKTTANKALCSLCPENEEVYGQMFCVDCEENLCGRCGNAHKKSRCSQNHQVVEFGSKFNLQEKNLRNSYCDHHPGEPLKMYCYKENVAICLICCVESHQSHRCANVNKAAGEFTEEIKSSLIDVISRLTECKVVTEKLDKYKKEFEEEVYKTEKSIRDAAAKLKALIDQHTGILVQNLKSVREQNLKAFEMAKQDVDRFRVMIDSYSKYTEEVLTRGSPVDVCRAAYQMLTRAHELKNLPANCSGGCFRCDSVVFHSSSIEDLLKQYGLNNAVGQLAVNKPSDRLLEFPTETSVNYGDDSRRIQLSLYDKEYKDVEKAVLSTAHNTVNQIVKIVRIQDKMLYEQYADRKATMDAVKPEAQNEMTLWHGTSADVLENTNQTEFNRSYFSMHAGMYGRGFYFAKNFNYSAQNTYSPPDANGFKYVYQCKVLTGEYAVGNQSMDDPPSRPNLRNKKLTPRIRVLGSTNLAYNSAVDNVINPTVFFIFDDYQAYPEYLIYFK